MSEIREKPSSNEAPGDTKERILDVAERLFAEKGFDAVSLRSITTAASVNLAAVNYHFGSKDALILECITRRLQPVNEARIALLEEAVEQSGKKPVPVEQIIEAFVNPIVAKVEKDNHSDRIFCKLMSRMMSESDDRVPTMMMKQFSRLVERFAGEFSRTLPELPIEEIHTRIIFTAGTMAHALMHFEKMALVSEGRVKNPSIESLRKGMIQYAAAGFAAPLPKGGDKK